MPKLQEILEGAVKDAITQAIQKIVSDPAVISELVDRALDTEATQTTHAAEAPIVIEGRPEKRKSIEIRQCPVCGKDCKRMYLGCCKSCSLKLKPRKDTQKQTEDVPKKHGRPVGRPKFSTEKIEPKPCDMCNAQPEDQQITEFAGRGHACNDPDRGCTAALFRKTKRADT